SSRAVVSWFVLGGGRRRAQSRRAEVRQRLGGLYVGSRRVQPALLGAARRGGAVLSRCRRAVPCATSGRGAVPGGGGRAPGGRGGPPPVAADDEPSGRLLAGPHAGPLRTGLLRLVPAVHDQPER